MCDSESYLVTLVGFFYTTLTLKRVQQNQANKDLETETLFHYRIAVLLILVPIWKEPEEAYFDSVYWRSKGGLQQGEEVLISGLFLNNELNINLSCHLYNYTLHNLSFFNSLMTDNFTHPMI